MTLALILIVALGLALVLAAAALPIRAWKRRDPTGETHHYHDGTRTVVKETRVLEGRAAEAPRFYSLPPQPAGAFFPELMRAAYRAGILNASAAEANSERADISALLSDSWDGDITA